MKEDNPGIYIPPPVIFAAIFIVAFYIQKIIPVTDTLFQKNGVKIAAVIFLLIALYFLARGVLKFIKSGNTLITMHPASSLQDSGIYRFTRNPMYVGLICLYVALACSIGNWWHIIFLPVLIVIMQEYVIKREEKYLEREFGQQYLDYKKKVRRWL
ncbi:MAG: isoprenylcysteine carboxylmethyltransferase family protein [Ginsengibacter sp.]